MKNLFSFPLPFREWPRRAILFWVVAVLLAVWVVDFNRYGALDLLGLSLLSLYGIFFLKRKIILLCLAINIGLNLLSFQLLAHVTESSLLGNLTRSAFMLLIAILLSFVFALLAHHKIENEKKRKSFPLAPQQMNVGSGPSR